MFSPARYAPWRRTTVHALLVALCMATMVHGKALAIGQWIDERSSSGGLLTPNDRAWYGQAFKSADSNQWRRALHAAKQAKTRLPAKAIMWAYYRRSGNHASFDELRDFIRANPHWPELDDIRRRAEEALPDDMPPKAVLDWFADFPPLGGTGQRRMAEALIAIDRRQDGLELLRQAWVTNTFSKREAQKFYRRHKQNLRPEDHIERMDRLLWAHHRYSARRMLSIVPATYRKVAEARLSLMDSGPGVDAKVAAVPTEMQDDPGLVYERLRWRRRKGFDDRARELLLPPPGDLGRRPDKWWVERRIQARNLLEDGEYEQAYKIASPHGLAPGSTEFAEAEFLAGWIALRFLGAPKQGYKHFTVLYDAVRYPVSLARAAYWSSRAARAAGDDDLAQRWLNIAAGYPAVYYGQLAIEQLGANRAGASWTLPEQPEPTSAEIDEFNKMELVRLVRMLSECGADDWARTFIVHLAGTLDRPEHRVLVPNLATSIGRGDLAVRASKVAMQTGIHAVDRGYPILETPEQTVEPALLFALMRQESEFNADAVSHAGAHGLMQLMPATARLIAKEIGEHYHRTRLTDPAYNIQLGAAYLAHLIDQYDGSYVMALAAYNAGPHRVDRWVKKFGDPRDPKTDVIDWVESITFSETRNYVQRVMENLQIYRARLGEGTPDLTLLADLRRVRPAM
jgi:soluble lytic murein transglycosylase